MLAKEGESMALRRGRRERRCATEERKRRKYAKEGRRLWNFVEAE